MTNGDANPSTETTNPGAGYQLMIRLRMNNERGMHGRVATVLGENGADILDIDIHEVGSDFIVRDFLILCDDGDQAADIVKAAQGVEGCELVLASDRTFQLHQKGKIGIHNKVHIRTNAELNHVYTPGVGRVCMAIAEDPSAAWSLTIKPNTIAVVTDGTAVLGLGDIGPEAAMPVMEGKCMLFKSFADIDAWPICLDTTDTEEIIQVVKAIAPGFGGILLEDISAPRCFVIEERLRNELDIPVFHDDQHGTAVVVLAGLMNALKLVNKRPEDIKVRVLGVGASGVACSKIMMEYGVKDVIGFDRTGAVYEGRPENMNPEKEWFANNTNREGFQGSLADALVDADVFLGLSGPGLVEADWIAGMGEDPIVFALANPVPEIMPDEIHGMARVIGTGRSDFPNQINNVLCFPGLFRGALDAGAKEITESMKIVAARAIAETILDEQLTEDYIIPTVFNEHVFQAVGDAVRDEAIRTGNNRPERSDIYI